MEIINLKLHADICILKRQLLDSGEIRCRIKSDQLSEQFKDMLFCILYASGGDLSVIEIRFKSGKAQEYRVSLSEAEWKNLIL